MPTNTGSLRIVIKYDGETCYAIPRGTWLNWQAAKQFMSLHGRALRCWLVCTRSKALHRRFNVNPRTIVFQVPANQLASFSVNMRRFLDEHQPTVEFNPWKLPMDCQPSYGNPGIEEIDPPALVMGT